MNVPGQQNLAQMLAAAQGTWQGGPPQGGPLGGPGPLQFGGKGQSLGAVGGGMLPGHQMHQQPTMPVQQGGPPPPPFQGGPVGQQPPGAPPGGPPVPLQQQMMQQQQQPQMQHQQQQMQMQQQQQQPQMQHMLQQQQPQMQQQQQPQMQQQMPQQQQQQQQQQLLQQQQMSPQQFQQMMQQRQQQQQPQQLQQQLQGPDGQPMQAQGMEQQQQGGQDPAGANGAAKSPDTSHLKIGMHVDAACAGWGQDMFPGVIREILSNGEIQVLWDGDEPSISNVPCENVKPKVAAAPATEEPPPASTVGVAGNDASVASPPVAAPAPAAMIAPVVASHESPQKRLHEEVSSNAAAPAPTAEAGASAPAVDLRSYRYDLGPGDEIEAPISNLRRRVEAEVRDGLMVTISLHITRTPSAGMSPAPAAARVMTSPVTAPPRPAAGAAPEAMAQTAPQVVAPQVISPQGWGKGGAAGMLGGKGGGGCFGKGPTMPQMPSLPPMPQIPAMPGFGMGGPLSLGMPQPGLLQQGGGKLQ